MPVSRHLDAVKRAGGDGLTEREKAYVRAALAYAAGSLDNATKELTTMLFDYPRGRGVCWLMSCCHWCPGRGGR